MPSITLTDLCAQLAETMRDLEAGAEPVLISRRGQPTGMLISWPQHQANDVPFAGLRVADWSQPPAP